MGLWVGEPASNFVTPRPLPPKICLAHPIATAHQILGICFSKVSPGSSSTYGLFPLSAALNFNWGSPSLHASVALTINLGSTILLVILLPYISLSLFSLLVGGEGLLAMLIAWTLSKLFVWGSPEWSPFHRTPLKRHQLIWVGSACDRSGESRGSPDLWSPNWFSSSSSSCICCPALFFPTVGTEGILTFAGCFIQP